MTLSTATFSFELIHTSQKSRARVGKIHTPHGVIHTPNFVAVGTNGTLKGLDNAQVASAGLELMFCNTYHLMLQPGTKIIRQAGGLHAFIHRSLPLITDSGGFQIFSLAYGSVASELKSCGMKKQDGSVLKITEEGVFFRSYRDGSKILLTPESSVQAQKDLGADIIIPLDELPPYHISEEALKASLERTHRWELRSLEEHVKNPEGQAMYGVIHGGVNPRLRQESCKELTKHPFDGFAIGGSVGKNQQEMFELLKMVTPQLPENKPVHLLGIGDLTSIAQGVLLGIDTFDSSYPTRSARHGVVFTEAGNLNLTKQENSLAFFPIDEECPCSTCRHYSRAYLHHLFKAHEMTAMSLATLHNVTYMVNLMRRYRERILLGEL